MQKVYPAHSWCFGCTQIIPEIEVDRQDMKRATILIASAVVALLCSQAAVLAAGACCAGGSSQAVPTRAPDNTLSAEEKAQGWKLLFDGKTFDGWACTVPDSKGWVIDNGAMCYNVQGPGYMYTKERFGDFELKIDLMVAKGTNSGVFFRWDDLNDPVQTGIEMQVLDSAGQNPPGKHACGAIYDVLAPSENAMKPAMEWNSVLLRCRGQYISVTMNGKRIIQMDLNRYREPHKNVDGTNNKFRTAYKDMPREGHIGLQDHGGMVWYKNIKIRKL